MTHPTPTITVNLDMSPHGAQRASHPHLYDLVLEWILANPDRPFTVEEVAQALGPLTDSERHSIIHAVAAAHYALTTRLAGNVPKAGFLGVQMFDILCKGGVYYRTAVGTFVYDTKARLRPLVGRRHIVLDNRWPIFVGRTKRHPNTPTHIPASAEAQVQTMVRPTKPKSAPTPKVEPTYVPLSEVAEPKVTAAVEQFKRLAEQSRGPKTTITDTLVLVETETEIIVATITTRGKKS